MTKRIIAISAMLLVCCGAALAQQPVSHEKDEAAIRAIIAGLADAWTRGDSDAWGRAFAEDADFTVWNGLYVKGRAAIARGHAQIFSTIYKDTKLDAHVRSIRFLRDDVAVVHVEGSVVKKGEPSPASPIDCPVLVMTRDKGQWLVAAFQNTRYQRAQSGSN